jgi:beta-glucosidase
MDPIAPIAERVEDLLSRMTLEEKIGQMTLVENQSIVDLDITDRFIGGILSGGGGYPRVNSPEGWVAMVGNYQEFALKTRLGIPIIYGSDGVHGHNNLKGATIFPHNIGLGAARDPDLLRRIGRATAEEMAATNVFWNFAPVLAVPQDIRWGRIYEGYSENTTLVSTLGKAYIEGLQGDDLADPITVLATPKHFVGDGGTRWGTSNTFIMQQFMLDQGDTQVDETTLRDIHMAPYIDAIDAGALSIMVSFSSWNGEKMHGNGYLLTDVLKNELGFTGFLVSDWGGIDQITKDYYDSVVAAINAGIDMNMVPYDYELFIDTMSSAVENGDISTGRIDDAVRRILNVKFKLGLFERPFVDESSLPMIGSEDHRKLAREAVAKTLVLLKNDHKTLPIAKDTALILVAGEAADDIGIQSGGWTIEWQGRSGNITEGTTILEGVENTVSADTRVYYDPLGKYDQLYDENGDPAIADIGIAVVGEQPYAEGVGDKDDLSLSEVDISVIKHLREHSEKLIIILVFGRPMIITDQLPLAEALVAAWLPGTEGQGVSDVLFGDFPFTGKLSYTWPRSMDQIPFDFNNIRNGEQGPLFPFGYGVE